MNQTPPQAIEIEQSILASCLIIDGAEIHITEQLKPDHFYKTNHQQIFSCISEMVAFGDTVDLPALVEKLREKQTLTKCGGAAYIASLLDQPISTTPETHCQIIRDKAARREMINAAHGIINRCYESPESTEAVINECQQDIGSIQPGIISDSSTSFSVLAHAAMDGFEEIQNQQGKLAGITTGFKFLDDLTGGLQKSDYIILAARPSMGKTALALNIACAAAKHVPVQIFSMEMSKKQLAMRIIASESRTNAHIIKTGNFRGEDWSRLNEAARKSASLPIRIDDTEGPHYQELRRRARQAVKRHRAGLLIFDYLQLVKSDNKPSRDREVAEISASFKGMSKELNVPILVLSQLNRALEMRSNKHPMMSDLRDSGTLEQDADIIMFLYRDEVYDKSENNPNRGIAEIEVAKHRNGPVGMCKLSWLKQYTRFENMAYESNTYDWGQA